MVFRVGISLNHHTVIGASKGTAPPIDTGNAGFACSPNVLEGLLGNRYRTVEGYCRRFLVTLLKTLVLQRFAMFSRKVLRGTLRSRDLQDIWLV